MSDPGFIGSLHHFLHGPLPDLDPDFVGPGGGEEAAAQHDHGRRTEERDELSETDMDRFIHDRPPLMTPGDPEELERFS